MFRTLVVGGTGSIGSAIVRHALILGQDGVTVFSRDEHKQHELKQEFGDKVKFIIGDVRSSTALNKALRGVNWCFHTAAMKHVTSCEENPFEAVKTNIIGTENLINAAIANEVENVLAISTDKAVHPTSVLGCSKLIMERLLKAANGLSSTKFASIRFGNILNSRGSVIPLWKKQIENGGPVTVTDENATRIFLDIDEAVKGAFEAILVMKGGEVFVVSCLTPKRILDMAKEICGDTPIEITGLRPGERLHEELVASNERVKLSNGRGLLVV